MKMNLGLGPNLGPIMATKLKSNGPGQLERPSWELCEAHDIVSELRLIRKIVVQFVRSVLTS